MGHESGCCGGQLAIKDKRRAKPFNANERRFHKDNQAMQSIADKIKFWEEQQQINSLLIPTVVEGAKNLERVTSQIEMHSKQIRKVANEQQRSKSELTKTAKKLAELDRDVDLLSEDLEESKELAVKTETKFSEQNQASKERFEQLESELALLRQREEPPSSLLQTLPLILSVAALGMAIVAWVN
jgi:septal ring factor EnvC (AmiA/AmiB activator)